MFSPLVSVWGFTRGSIFIGADFVTAATVKGRLDVDDAVSGAVKDDAGVLTSIRCEETCSTTQVSKRSESQQQIEQWGTCQVKPTIMWWWRFWCVSWKDINGISSALKHCRKAIDQRCIETYHDACRYILSYYHSYRHSRIQSWLKWTGSLHQSNRLGFL